MMAGGDPGERPGTAGRRFPTLPFVVVALAAALVGGFGLGAALLLLPLAGVPTARWYAAGAQAHAAVQLFGWGGGMALGVGLHVLPRLRGAPLRGARARPWAWAALAAGLALRGLGQPAAAAVGEGPAAVLLAWLGLGLGPVLTLLGAGLAVGLLAATHRAGPPAAGRAGWGQVEPLLLAAFGMLLGALVAQAAAGFTAAARGVAVLPPAVAAASTDLALIGFLVVLSVAVSARFFPLYLRVRPAGAAGLRLALALLLAGLSGRLLAPLLPAVRPLGDLLVGGGLLVAVTVVFGPAGEPAGRRARRLPLGLVRRPPPPAGRERAPTPADGAARALVRSAYGWLLLAAGLALAAGVGGPSGWGPPPDAERHALGAGFVTLLIVGMGTLLLPGFAGGRAPGGPATAGLWLGNLAAALRVFPVLTGWLAPALLPPLARAGLMGLGGLLGGATVICLGLVVRGALRESRRQG